MAEFAVGEYVSRVWQDSSTPVGGSNGGWEIVGGDRVSFVSGEVFFSASGFRSNKGSLSSVTKAGRYWSGSAYSSTTARYVYFSVEVGTENWMITTNNNHLDVNSALPVRCVKS
jgi:hypothetical protein